MRVVRRHLRRGIVAWLVCHALTFTALVPRDCCVAHGHAAPANDESAPATADGPPCHEAAAEPAPSPGSHCDMAAADGAACPMHRTAAPGRCAMSGVCHAPESALAAVVLQAAVLVRAGLPVPDLAVASVALRPGDSARSLAVPPDAPPPRL
ncbi:MAG TPA: hypothetical protein VMW48_02270 [Vicinamibacterales bacterium]|nr:hypothetical protein [Vicinamibacterales bacterium]